MVWRLSGMEAEWYGEVFHWGMKTVYAALIMHSISKLLKLTRWLHQVGITLSQRDLLQTLLNHTLQLSDSSQTFITLNPNLLLNCTQ